MKEPLFPQRQGIRLKIGKIYDYVFRDFPFAVDSLDYEEYWNRVSQENRPVSLFKLKLIASMIDEGSSVLDIGCGDGNLLQYLSREKRIRAHGIEVSEKAVALARQNGIRAEVADITQEGFQLSAQYDYIVISEVLEHLSNPEQLMCKLRGKFRRYIIVTIPNTGYAGERLRLLMGKFPRQWVLHPSEHIRFWTVSDFIYWCEQLGFKVERYQGMQDEFYDIKIRIWKYYPTLCSRYVLYLLKEK